MQFITALEDPTVGMWLLNICRLVSEAQPLPLCDVIDPKFSLPIVTPS